MIRPKQPSTYPASAPISYSAVEIHGMLAMPDPRDMGAASEEGDR